MKNSLFDTQDAALAYARKAGFTIIRSKLASVTLAFKARGEKIELKAWRGTKAVKPAFYYTFRDFARAEKYAIEYISNVQESEQRKAASLADSQKKRANLKASDHWTVGDVVYTSWGYDQTNVEFFQIVELKPKSVIVRQVGSNCSDHGQPGGGKTQPQRCEFVGPAFSCPLNEHGHFSAGPCWNKDKPSFRHSVSKWTGRALYTSSDH